NPSLAEARDDLLDAELKKGRFTDRIVLLDRSPVRARREGVEIVLEVLRIVNAVAQVRRGAGRLHVLVADHRVRDRLHFPVDDGPSPERYTRGIHDRAVLAYRDLMVRCVEPIPSAFRRLDAPADHV